MKATDKKVWFITGSSRGLGKSLTATVLAHGDKVVATARNIKDLGALVAEYPESIYPVALDVTNKQQVADAVASAIAHYGRIDVLVNNAGFGIIGAAEAFTDEQVTSQLATNLYGPIEITRAVIPHMRKQGSGSILQISSIGGRVGGAGLSIYQAAKFGLGGFSESLRKELEPFGIKVTSIEPGGFRTDWAGASMSYAAKMAGYEKTVDWMATFFAETFVPMGDPNKAAKVMIDLIEHSNPPAHLVLGSEAIGLLTKANEVRQAEMDEWMPVSLSTNADDAVNFLETEASGTLAKLKGL